MMIKVNFELNNKSTKKILCLGSHADDIEIGCGGTILKLVEKYKNISFFWVVLSSGKMRADEAYSSANLFLKNVQGEKEIIIKEFQDSFFPFLGGEIKKYFEELKQIFFPDIIFTHFRNDLHQDHRLISELTWNTFRDHLILEYEVPKYDGDLGAPNLFVHLNTLICEKKIDFLMKSFKTQQSNSWFDRETFFSIMRLRGMESNSPSKYAEAFYCRKLVLL